MILNLLKENITNFFINVEPYLAAKIPKSDHSFKSYLPKVNTTLNETELEAGFENASKSFKRFGGDGLDVLKSHFGMGVLL